MSWAREAQSVTDPDTMPPAPVQLCHTQALGTEPGFLKRGGRLVQQLERLVRERQAIGTKLTTEPEQAEPDTLDVGGLDSRNNLLGLLDEG